MSFSIDFVLFSVELSLSIDFVLFSVELCHLVLILCYLVS